MGGTSWSDKDYRSRAATRASTGAPTFAYNASVASGAVPAAAHPSMDPKKKAGPSSVLAGQNVREARDSKEHPCSNAVFLGLDVTGSMLQVPKTIQQKLVSLMALLLQKGYLSDPALLVCGIGDATTDRVPMQLGQFEAGIEVENDLTNLYLEGNGGGQIPPTESYELALYFLARKTAIDCFEKRGKKGYAILIGDERAYPVVDKRQVETIFGDKLEANIPLAAIVAEVQTRYDLYFIMPNLTTHFDQPVVTNFWKELLGQNFITLDDPEGISELIATLIGHSEGVADADSLDADLAAVGTSPGAAAAVSRAMATVAKGKGELTPLAGTGLATP